MVKIGTNYPQINFSIIFENQALTKIIIQWQKQLKLLTQTLKRF
jgi:hypothetical protein